MEPERDPGDDGMAQRQPPRPFPRAGQVEAEPLLVIHVRDSRLAFSGFKLRGQHPHSRVVGNLVLDFDAIGFAQWRWLYDAYRHELRTVDARRKAPEGPEKRRLVSHADHAVVVTDSQSP